MTLIETGSLEITTKIGCKINCKFCPQISLIENYRKISSNYELSFENFKKCIDKIPKSVRIDFSGMCEPFLNKDCFKMIEYSFSKGNEICLYSTLIGCDVEKLQGLKFSPLVIHLPDIENNTKIEENDEYLEKILFSKEKLNVDLYVSHGNISNTISKILKGKNVRKINLINRAGNVKFLPSLFKKGKLECSSCGSLFNRNVLLPNCDVLICCMDYSLENNIGNLLNSDYEMILNNFKKEVLKKKMETFDEQCICRNCFNSKEKK